MQQIAFRAMHCEMMAAVDRDTPQVARRLEQVPDWFEVWEQRLSRFRPDSELSWVNQNAGQDVQVSAVMQDVLRAAKRAARESDGLVTPTVLVALEEAGYDRSFEKMKHESAPLEIEGSNGCSNTPSSNGFFQLKVHARKVHLASGTKLDVGGIAKGWAADRAVQRLGKLGPALVDAGGDIAVSAPLADGDGWPIGVTDPFDEEKQIDLLRLDHGGVATSGRDYRRWQRNRTLQHHIIDPRTNLPAQTDILTATVVAPSAQTAEMAAKVVLISGSVEGIAWLDQRPELAGLVVLEDGERIHSRRWMNYVWR